MSETEENKNENLPDHLKEELEAAAKDKDSVIVKGLDVPTPPSAPTPPPAPSAPMVTNGEAAPAPVEKKRRVGYALWVKYNDLSTLRIGNDIVDVTFEERQVDLDTHEVLDRRPMLMRARRPVAGEIVLYPAKDQG